MPAVIDNERFRKLLRSYPAGAVELLFGIFNKSLVTFAYSLTHDPDAAKDIVQDTFLHVYANNVKLSNHHERSIEHYLVQIVRFKSISYYRKVRHLSLDDLLFHDDLPAGHRQNSVEADLIEKEIVRQVHEVVITFPKRERECLLMRFEDDFGIDEIAQRLRISRKAVERSITSAKKRLRKWATKHF